MPVSTDRALCGGNLLSRAMSSCRRSMLGFLSRVCKGPLSPDDRIDLIVLIVVTGFCIAVAFHYVVGQYFGKPWPANTFLNTPTARFGDFKLVVYQSASLNPFAVDYGGFAGTPFAQFVGYLFSLVGSACLRVLLFLACFFLGFVPMVRQYLYGLKSRLTLHRALVLFALVFLTYPVLFALDRANFDLIACPILLLFVWAYRKQKYAGATCLLALAISLKLYAAVFILIFVIDRRYRYAFLTVFTTVFISAASLSIFRDGLIVEAQKYLTALSGMVSNPSFGSDFVYTSDTFSGLTMLTRWISVAFNHPVNLPDHPNVRMVYFMLVGAAGLYLIIQLRRKPKPLWSRMAVLAIVAVLLPINTHDYRLLYLYPPMLMFLATDEPSRHDLLIVILWGLLLVPKNYWPLDTTENIGMVINPLLLAGLLVCLIPEAFSRTGLSSLFRAPRPEATGERLGKLENPRSS